MTRDEDKRLENSPLLTLLYWKLFCVDPWTNPKRYDNINLSGDEKEGKQKK